MLLITLTSAVLFVAPPMTSVVAFAAPDRVQVSVPVAPNPHLQNARTALEKGDVALARREYQFAQVVDRDAGVVPVDASNGLAELLFAQSKPREAAEIMEQLADEAGRAGRIDLEASALVSAVWLRMESGDRNAAKQGVRRLHEIARDRRISPETRALLEHTFR